MVYFELLKKHIKIVLLLVAIVLSSLFFYLTHDTEEKDPLKELFSVEISKNNLHSADFITSSISAYSGPVSNSINECKKNFVMESLSGKVLASFNKNFTFNGDRLDIKEELNPVLGHAIANEEINWYWDSEKLEYTFLVAKGDELFWRCYFANETNFFKNFFLTGSVQAIGEKNISNDYFIKVKVSDKANNFSDYEYSENKELNLFSNKTLEEIDLGYINVSSSILDNGKVWENLFLTPIQYSDLNFSLNDSYYYQTSTIELLQNPSYTFLKLLVFSSNEIERKMAREAVENISIKYLDNSYNMKLKLNDTVPNNVSYQIFIDDSMFPAFYQPQDDLSSKEISHSFIRDGKGPVLTIINDKKKNCTTDYAPVCGELNGNKQTFPNECLLNLSGANFLSVGTCDEYISSSEVSY